MSMTKSFEKEQSVNVYWITGLSGSGKTTLCNLFVQHLRKKGVIIVKLDGDELRSIFESNGHDRSSRLKLAHKYGKLCQMLSKQGVNVAISTISLFHEVHQWNRLNIPGYKEIYLDVPVEVVKLRDPKKIYERAEKGELENVAGVDLKVEYPLNPDVILRYDEDKSPDDVLQELLIKLNQIDNLNIL